MSHSILLIEDNAILAENIIQFMESKSYLLDYSSDGQQGLTMALENEYDVVILDLSLPSLDGIEICKQIKSKHKNNTPILMLTARDSQEDMIDGFQSGADDYLTKPFSLDILELRCRALTKRHLLHKPRVQTLGTMEINHKERKVYRQGQEIRLNKIPYQILEILAERHPETVSRSRIQQLIWGDHFNDSESLRTHIYDLRQKLDKPFQKAMIKTVHGVGFKIEVDL